MTASNAVFIGNQYTCTCRNIQTSQLCDGLYAAANDLGVHGAVCTQNELAELCALLRIEEVRTLLLHLSLNGRTHIGITDDRLFGSTDRAVIKGLRVDDALDRQRDIGSALDVCGAVARANADCRRTGRVSGTYHRRTTGRKDHCNIGVFHQVIGCLHGRNGNAGYQILICTRLRDRLTDDPALRDAAQCAGMGREYDRVARLNGNFRLEQCGRGGVGRGD